jgi:beta-N-acetylhexosaminidase
MAHPSRGAGRFTFWRRRLLALLAPAALAAGIWVALGDGTSADDGAPSTATDGGADATVDAAPPRKLSAGELAGERVIAGFPGRRPPAKVKQMIGDGELAGVILFSENLGGRRHARRLIHRLQAIQRPAGLRDPLLVMIDQEGGLVKRLPGPPNASAQQMGRRGRAYSRRQGARTARNLRSVGVNVNLAPVLDVGRPGSAIRAQHRSFGGTPSRVIRTAIRFATAMQTRGVAATGKHFPGLGAAPEDTDFAVQRIRLRRSELRRIDERPYGPFSSHHGDLVMISTAIYPHLSHKPAAFAKPIATGELRRHIGFRGVSISDALETVSARDFGGPAKVGVAAAGAGTDLALFTDFRAAATAERAIIRALQSGRLNRADFEQSAQRVLDLRASLAHP